MKTNPTIIIQLDQTETDACKRLSKRRLDPVTGCSYNLNVDLIREDAIKNRLTIAPEDSKIIIAKGYAEWKDNLADIEDYFKDRLKVLAVSGRSIDDTSEQISDLV